MLTNINDIWRKCTITNLKWKKRSEETQTLRTGCSKAEPKIFALPQTPFPGARDGQNVISWRWSLPLPTNRVWWGSMHAISSYRDNRATYIPMHPHPQIGPITIHCTSASAQRNKNLIVHHNCCMLLHNLWKIMLIIFNAFQCTSTKAQSWKV